MRDPVPPLRFPAAILGRSRDSELLGGQRIGARRWPNLEFAIEWAPGTDRKSYQIRSGRDELRAFIDSGERGEWTHYVLHSAAEDRTEFALGETRRPGGERVATFVAVAEFGDDGRMRRYLVARSPAIAFGGIHVK